MTPADEAQVGRVVEAITSALPHEVIGLYLHGSAVLGGLRPTSDLDVLAVIGERLDDSSRRQLVHGLLGVSGRSAPRPGRPVEVSVVTVDQLATWSHPPVVEFQYGEWLRDVYESGHVPGREVAPDLTILLATVRNHGVALLGPRPGTVVPSIPDGDLVAASIAGTDGLLADLAGDERNVLLTFARMVVTADTGRIVPKDVAADTVAGQVVDGDLLAAAADDYRGTPSLDWSAHTDEVRACVLQLVELVRAAAG